MKSSHHTSNSDATATSPPPPRQGVKDLIAKFNRPGSPAPLPPSGTKTTTPHVSLVGSLKKMSNTLSSATAVMMAPGTSLTGLVKSAMSAVGAAGVVVNSVTNWGVSLKWLIQVLKGDPRVRSVMRRRGEHEAIMEDIVSVFGEMAAEKDDVSIVEMLRRSDPSMIKDVADVFISYARKYLIVDIIGCLESLLEREKKNGKADVFVWLDLLCVNQRVHKKFDPDFFSTALHKTIETISRVVVIACPWDNSYNLTRSWCLWELYCATQNESTKVEIMTVPSQRELLRHALRSNLLSLVEGAGKIDVTKAQAFLKTDQEMILNAARAAKGGITAVQESVAIPIRNWMTREAMSLIDEMEAKGENMEELVFLCNEIALLLGTQGLFDLQEQYTRKGIELGKKCFGEEHPEMASYLNNLALLLQDQGKYSESETLYHQSLAILKKTLGGNHPGVATALNNLALLHNTQGKFEQAESLYREALSIDKKAFGANNSNVATDLNNLADLFQAQGKYREAEEMFLESLSIDKKVLDKNDLSLTIGLSNLASLLQASDRLSEAEIHIQNALMIDKQYFGGNHSSFAIDSALLASILNDQGKSNEASLICEKAREVGNLVFPEPHAQMAYILRIQAEINLSQNRLDEAESNSRLALEKYRSAFRAIPDHVDIAESLLTLAKVLFAKGGDTFSSVSKECLEMFENKLGPQNPKTVKARFVLEGLSAKLPLKNGGLDNDVSKAQKKQSVGLDSSTLKVPKKESIPQVALEIGSSNNISKKEPIAQLSPKDDTVNVARKASLKQIVTENGASKAERRDSITLEPSSPNVTKKESFTQGETPKATRKDSMTTENGTPKATRKSSVSTMSDTQMVTRKSSVTQIVSERTKEAEKSQ